jgi:hypothetical protein
MKQTCYTCAETKHESFSGACQVAGELSDQYAKQEHPDCWQKPVQCKCNGGEKHCACKTCS